MWKDWWMIQKKNDSDCGRKKEMIQKNDGIGGERNDLER
jgi:hypothetical protein